MADRDNLELAELEAETRQAAAEPKMPQNGRELEAVYDIPVQISAVLGRRHSDCDHLLRKYPA